MKPLNLLLITWLIGLPAGFLIGIGLAGRTTPIGMYNIYHLAKAYIKANIKDEWVIDKIGWSTLTRHKKTYEIWVALKTPGRESHEYDLDKFDCGSLWFKDIGDGKIILAKDATITKRWNKNVKTIYDELP